MTKEDSNGCWNWTGYTKGFGYGQTTIGSRTDGTRKTITAHRAMWIACNGSIPENMWILHHCDNPKCINPKHLYVGTMEDNVRDRENRNRNIVPNLKHEKHPMSKIGWNEVNQIRSASGTQEEIAKKFGIARRTVSDIKRFKTWIPQPPKENGDD